jgi:hypothetical protein
MRGVGSPSASKEGEMSSLEGLFGSAEDHREAYEDFARKVAMQAAAEMGFSADPGDWSDEEKEALQQFFDERGPIDTRVSIQPQPHNQWVKVYIVGPDHGR